MAGLRVCNGFYQIFRTVNFQIIEVSLDSYTFKNICDVMPIFLKNIKYNKSAGRGVAPQRHLDVSLSTNGVSGQPSRGMPVSVFVSQSLRDMPFGHRITT